MTSPQHNIVFESALLCLLALLWGWSYLLIKVAVETIPPITLIAIRVFIAAIFLSAIVIWKGERLPRDGKTRRLLLVQSFLTSIGAWTVLAWGQQFVDSALTSVLNSTSPVFVFLITFFFTRHETTSWLKLFGACMGVVGVALIVGADALQGLGQQVLAQLAVLSSAVMYAGAAMFGKRFTHLTPLMTATCTMLWASLFLVPLSLVIDEPWTLAPSTLSMMAAVTLAVLGTGVALLIYFRLLRTLGSLGTTSQSYLRAGVGVAFGVIVLGEHITPVIGAGIVAALIGVIAINFPKRA
jgi:drug/metabolite transporter (DMT)-like permease